MIILIILITVILLYVLSTMCRRGHKGLEALRGWAYAHRGLHGDGVPENSMEAFRRAKEAGFGVELDIHLLADGNLAVIHDSLLVRTTGAQGRIEDLTTDQLSAYRLEETEQTIPEFRQVLELFAGKTPLIIELKCVGNNYPQLCQTACDMLEHYPGPYCMESFDPRCVRWLCKNRPDIVRGQLSENYFLSNTVKLPWVLKLLLSFQMLNFLLKPDFVSYRYAHLSHFSNFLTEKVWGAQSVTWTLKTKEEYDKATSEGRIPIFEGFLP